ncbi:MAG: tRNA (adenosine(37)-N6)-threonylcarbamoyltransferase complex ATPase subunit type 1 TsaE [Parcubacteria group bacterium]
MTRMHVLRSVSEKQTKELGAKLADKLTKDVGKNPKPRVFLLFGDLGSGKTAFVKGFAGFLGVKRVLSPTFAIVKSYKIKRNGYTNLLHADLYRVKNLKELKNIGFPEILNDNKTITLIEWPELISSLSFPRLTREFRITKIYFFHGKKENERTIRYNS